MNDIDIRWMEPIIKESDIFVRVNFPKRDYFITETQIISLFDFENKNNLSFIDIDTNENYFSAIFRKKANTENKPISQ